MRLPEGIHLRDATVEDLDTIFALWREMWDYHYRYDTRFQAADTAKPVIDKWLREQISSPAAHLRVAVEGSNKPIGYVLAMVLENPPTVPWSTYGFISEIAVTETHHRRGIGEALLADAHHFLSSHSVPYIEANVSVLNPASSNFWNKHGYSDYVMRKRLDLASDPSEG